MMTWEEIALQLKRAVWAAIEDGWHEEEVLEAVTEAIEEAR